MSKIDKVRQDLESGKSITPLQAFTKYGSLRLAAVIFELKNKGLKIKTEIVNVGTKKKPTNVAKYSII